MNRYNVSGYTRITKAEARKLWKEGREFWMTACNMRPCYGIRINHSSMSVRNDGTTTFDGLYNSFAYYNCNNETGRYLAFYI